MVESAPPGTRVAIVTGGTRGLGAAITARLLHDGGTVVAAYRSDDAAAQRFRAGLGSVSDRLVTVQADVADPSACAALVADTVARFDRVDHLVNNAGVLNEAKVLDTDPALWDATIAVNLSSAFHLARAAWPTMVEQHFGRIVNVGSITAAMGNAVEIAYGTAKAGMVGLTRSLARAGARKGITVNCVIPGVFDTDMTAGMDPAFQQQVRAMIPVARIGRPEEFAAAVAYVVSDDAGFLTGQSITLDGGLGMGS